MKSKIDSIVDDYMYAISDIIDKDIDKSIRHANNEMYNEANKMYDTFITQFYKYKTKYYIRHWEGIPGTQQGYNLFLGKDIRKDSKHSKLIINSPSDFLYKSNGGGQYSEPMSDDYKIDSARDVLESVMSGYRFPHFSNPMVWKGSYKGKYFKYDGEMGEAFNKFNTYFDDIAEGIIYNSLKKLGYN